MMCELLEITGFYVVIERLSGSAVSNQTGSHALPRTVDAYTESVSPSVLRRENNP